jgi:hypothetical protein
MYLLQGCTESTVAKIIQLHKDLVLVDLLTDNGCGILQDAPIECVRYSSSTIVIPDTNDKLPREIMCRPWQTPRHGRVGGGVQ